MKFAISCVVGDTELYDKLCGKYGSRTSTVKNLCHHCDCPTDFTCLPEHQKTTELYKPSNLDELRHDDQEACKSISHHPKKMIFTNWILDPITPTVSILQPPKNASICIN